MLEQATLNQAAQVLAGLRPGERADTALRAYFAARRYLRPGARRALSRTVFAYFRWLRWLDDRAAPQARIAQAVALQERFVATPGAIKPQALVARAVPDWVREEMQRYQQLVVLGDFNIAPDDRDVHDRVVWNDDSILTSTAERAALNKLLALGLHDSFRLHSDEAGVFSWWDYRMAGFRRNLGLRIDLVLISEALKSRAAASGIEREPRTWERPSDHAPVWVELG